MNKQLKLLAAAAALALAPTVNAASTPAAPFNVTVTLTSVCSITAGPADVTFTYTSFQGAIANSAGGGYSVRCTNNLPFTMALDATTGSVGGLTYNIAAPAGGTGTGAAVAYSITGTIAAGQGGDATAPVTSARTLTVSY
jgi:spore coat protein U-like protein